jgi:hypothetical protein
MDISVQDLAFSIILTWGWGLAIPLILRYGLLKRPLEKNASIFTVGGLWLVNVFIFTAIGSESRTHAALFLVAAASYWILTKKTIQSEIEVDATPPIDVEQKQACVQEAPLHRDHIDEGFKGKRIKIFLVAAAISALTGAIFSSTSSDWFLAIPAVATFFAVLVVGQPESTRNWRSTIIWSLLFSPAVLVVSFIGLGFILNFAK